VSVECFAMFDISYNINYVKKSKGESREMLKRERGRERERERERKRERERERENAYECR
jgi:hypothetical protein